MALKKFQQSLLSQLKNGDRFYFPKNRNQIFEFTRKEMKSARCGYEYFYKREREEKSCKKDKLVIYLRNINDN